MTTFTIYGKAYDATGRVITSTPQKVEAETKQVAHRRLIEKLSRELEGFSYYMPDKVKAGSDSFGDLIENLFKK